MTAIELKYKTSRLNVLVSGEEFQLQNQAAEPPNRYQVIKDLVRGDDYDRDRREGFHFLTNITSTGTLGWSRVAISAPHFAFTRPQRPSQGEFDGTGHQRLLH